MNTVAALLPDFDRVTVHTIPIAHPADCAHGATICPNCYDTWGLDWTLPEFDTIVWC